MGKFSEILDLQDLQSDDQRELLDFIDDLQVKGLSADFNYPQLVVFGEQSSGKSSVLEAISGIPFLRKDIIGTRHATEVILRRSHTDRIRVSIKLHNTGNSKADAALLNFGHEVESFTQLEKSLKDARNLIMKFTLTKGFSRDVLCIEIWGPQQPVMTIVDLPGFISSSTKDYTKNFTDMVHDISQGYLKNPQSIILAVVPAKSMTKNQEVFDKVRKLDDDENRVLGIITKPDTIVSNLNEVAYLSLAHNEIVPLNLGWHTIIIPHEIEQFGGPVPRCKLDAIEKEFFENSIFCSLPASHRGVFSLRKRLSNLLFENAKQSLPKLRASLESQAQFYKAELGNLGLSRKTLEGQQAYLFNLSTELQHLCTNAINGSYDDPFFKGEGCEHRRLCAVIAGRNLEFAADLEQNGIQWRIYPDCDISPPVPNPRSRSEAIRRCYDLLVKTKGSELPGLPNSLLVRELFCEYNRPWAIKARHYVKMSWKKARDFVYEALDCKTDHSVTEAYFKYVLEGRLTKLLEEANLSLDELLTAQKYYPFTVNSEYCKKLQIAEARRWTKKLSPNIAEFVKKEGNSIEAEALESFIVGTINGTTEENMDLVAAEYALDAMLAYYEIALKTFIDNVFSLTINLKILQGLPLLFQPSNILDIDDKLLNSIAGESEDVSEHLMILHDKLKALNEGVKFCRQHESRTYSATKSPLPQKPKNSTIQDVFRDLRISRMKSPMAQKTSGYQFVSTTFSSTISNKKNEAKTHSSDAEELQSFFNASCQQQQSKVSSPQRRKPIIVKLPPQCNPKPLSDISVAKKTKFDETFEDSEDTRSPILRTNEGTGVPSIFTSPLEQKS